MSEEKDIERIEELLGKLKALEDIDPLYVNQHMGKLRHFVFFVFSRIEYSLDLLFAQQANAQDKTLTNLIKNGSAVRDIAEMLANVPFSKKIEIYLTSSIITKEIRDEFKLVNKYRNWFAHPIVYEIKVKELQHDYNMQKQLLKTLVKAMNLLNIHFEKKREKDDERLGKKIGMSAKEVKAMLDPYRKKRSFNSPY